MIKYKKLIIYYFTGTGNALMAARWIIKKASTMGIATELHPIDRDYRPDPGSIDSATLMGFLYPTHGFNAAPSMLYFLAKFPRARGAHAFVLNTRAGSKIFRLLGPGLSGLAQVLPMLILAIKRYSIRGGLPLDMPSNWISLHPGYSDRWISFIIKRCEEITGNFTDAILAGKRRFFRTMITLPLDIAIAPIAVIYFLIGRFILAKTFIYSSSCNNCMICVNNCPVGAIEIRHGKPYWKFTCESCMRCIDNCPQQAIQASHLFFLIIVLISQIPLTMYLFTSMPILTVINYPIIVYFLNSYIMLLMVFFLYGALQWLLQLKPVNALFTYTSLTRYWRRYRAPGIKLRDYQKDPLN
ncbi:MAG TPA: EFR1 family ferrodoxin [Spirochaetota bacterium]|nr:EFR1 family ferrodoxin [Spirochaetota bacterium]HPV43376.1 EFR1 family ferrodoxin [Spirochaetota bacterium]